MFIHTWFTPLETLILIINVSALKKQDLGGFPERFAVVNDISAFHIFDAKTNSILIPISK